MKATFSRPGRLAKRLICLSLVLVSLLTPSTSLLPGAEIWGMGVTAEAAQVVNGVTIQGTVPTRTIRYRAWPMMNGNDVKWIQSTLNAYGRYGLKVDGWYGTGTRDACKRFQQAMRITADGIWGPQTTTKMKNWINAQKEVWINLASGNYNPGTLIEGQSYSINGLITSNYKLTNVTVGIYYNNNSPTKQVKTVNPGSNSYDIRNLDRYIKFGSLKAGTYTLRVIATANGQAMEKSKKQFTITKNNSAELARSIINNSNITLYTRHADPPRPSYNYDGATAYDNIRDTRDGKAVKNSSYQNAPGKTTTLDINILKIMLDLSKKYGKITVTSLAGSSHSSGSKHYVGKAMDFYLTNGLLNDQKGREIFTFLRNKGYNIKGPYNSPSVFEKNHYHVELK